MRSRTLQTAIALHEVEQPPTQRTYVVFGSRRGGTSLVAGVVRALGVDLGDIGTRTNNEDGDFQNRPVPHMRKTIARRNEEHDVWGWKYPAAATYLPELMPQLRNPWFIVVFRDPVAAALSQARLDRDVNRRTPAMSFSESSGNVMVNAGLVLASGHPCLLVSNEKAREDPSTLIDEVADFLVVARPGDEARARILDYVAPGKYKAFERYFGDAPEQGTPTGRDAPDAPDSPDALSRLRRRLGRA